MSYPQKIFYDFSSDDFTNYGTEGATYDLTTPLLSTFPTVGGQDSWNFIQSGVQVANPTPPISGIDYTITMELYIDNPTTLTNNCFLFAEASGVLNTGVEAFARSSNSLTQLNTNGAGSTTSNTVNLQSWNTYTFAYDSGLNQTTVTLNGTDTVISGGGFTVDSLYFLCRTTASGNDDALEPQIFVTNLSIDW